MSDLTVTNNDVWVASVAVAPTVPALTAVCGLALPIAASHNFTKLQRKSAGIIADIEKDRVKLCEQHATKTDDGTPKKNDAGAYDIPDLAAFTADFQTLLAQPVTLTNCRAVKLSEFGSAACVSGDVLAALGPFVVEDE